MGDMVDPIASLAVKPLSPFDETLRIVDRLHKTYVPEYKLEWVIWLQSGVGACDWMHMKITLSKSDFVVMSSKSMGLDAVKWVMIHEIAHAYWHRRPHKSERSHGPRFRQIMYGILLKEGIDYLCPEDTI